MRIRAKGRMSQTDQQTSVGVVALQALERVRPIRIDWCRFAAYTYARFVAVERAVQAGIVRLRPIKRLVVEEMKLLYCRHSYRAVNAKITVECRGAAFLH